MDDLDAVVRSMNAERYGKSVWWETKTPTTDDDLIRARRRRDMEADFDAHDARVAATQ